MHKMISTVFSIFDPLLMTVCLASLSLTFSIFILGNSKTSTCYSNSDDCKTRKKKKILFVTAHPDDECMFFGPSILHFTENLKETSTVYLLCLSSGNFYGKGTDRIKELWSSCKCLGIPSENILLYKCDDMPDDPTIMWPTYHTSSIISQFIHCYDIDSVITFDAYGISNHLNHGALHNALEHLIDEDELPKSCEAFCLDSVNVMRKYSSILDVILSYFFSDYAFTLTIGQVFTVQNAMRAHASQYVWFRKLYIFFSRYVLINTFTKMN